MKTRNASPKSRPITALFIVVGTVFVLAGRSCGALGALVSATSERMVGTAGLALFACAAWTLAFILATPPGTLTRMILALWRQATRPRPSVVVVSKKSAVETVRELREALDEGQQAPSPRVRQNLDAVRSALKNLDFNKNEYEPLVARMDGTQPFETLVKSALKSLREVN